jgi:hypothetical protein
VGPNTSDVWFYTLATSSTKAWASGQSTLAGNSDLYLLSTEGVPPLPRLTDLKITPIAFAGGCQSSTGRILRSFPDVGSPFQRSYQGIRLALK